MISSAIFPLPLSDTRGDRVGPKKSEKEVSASYEPRLGECELTYIESLLEVASYYG